MKIQTGLSISEEIIREIDDLRGKHAPRSPVIEELIILGLEAVRHQNSTPVKQEQQ